MHKMDWNGFVFHWVDLKKNAKSNTINMIDYTFILSFHSITLPHLKISVYDFSFSSAIYS